MRYQTRGLWLCDTRQGAVHTTQGGGERGGFWLSDTRHMDPKVPGGEGGVLALRYQTPGPEGDRRGTHRGGAAGEHK